MLCSVISIKINLATNFWQLAFHSQSPPPTILWGARVQKSSPFTHPCEDVFIHIFLGTILYLWDTRFSPLGLYISNCLPKNCYRSPANMGTALWQSTLFPFPRIGTLVTPPQSLHLILISISPPPPVSFPFFLFSPYYQPWFTTHLV